MTAISGVTDVSAISTQPLTTAGSAELDQDDFMTLFITQLQHQDPMEPMDSADMASQMAEFSNMEATLTMSNNIAELLEYQTSQNNLQLLTLLDQEVRVSGNGIGVSGEEIGSGEYDLASDADTVTLSIVDAAGLLVNRLDLGAQKSGSHDIEWDGTDSLGNIVDDGAYFFSIDAYSESGQNVVAEYSAMGKVTGVDYATGTAILVLDNHVSADVGSVISVI